MNLAEKINIEKEQSPYNHPEMVEIETAMFSLCDKMKDELLAGEYDYIISDDKSGRIPSLVFKNIIENLHSDKRINILGLAAGRQLSRVFKYGAKERDQADLANDLFVQIQDVLKRKVKPKVDNKALVVTEYIHSGDSIKNLKWLMEHSGVSFDIATLNSFLVKELEESDVKVFTSDFHIDSENPIFGNAQDYSGIETIKSSLPFPVLWSKIIKDKGKTFTPEQENQLKQAYQYTEEEQEEYYSADEKRRKEINAQRDNRWAGVYDQIKADSQKISPEDLKELRQRINQTRQDIKMMAEKIANQLKSDQE